MLEVVVGEEREARRISQQEWAFHWPEISVSLDRVAEFWSPYWTKQSIYNDVVAGNFHAWGFGKEKDLLNVIVITRVLDFPANRILSVVLAFGNHLDECLPMIEAVMQRFAIATNCTLCETTGRSGWLKRVKKFHPVGIVMRAEIVKEGVH